MSGLARLPAHAAARRLARRPGQVAMAVAVLALGVGLTAAMFAVVWGSFLRGLRLPEAGRIVQVARRSLSEGSVTPDELAAWKARAQGPGAPFEALAGWVGAGQVWSGDGAPAAWQNGAYASAELFAVAGVAPERGRVLRTADELPGAPPVVVISDTLWRQRYGADPGVLGRRVEIGGEPGTVVGIMPPGFQFPLRQDYWQPLGPLLARLGSSVRFPVQVVGRLGAGVSSAAAADRLEALARGLAPATVGNGEPAPGPPPRTRVTPFVRAYTADAREPLWLATAAAFGVLLLACANVANLLAARGLARSQELAVRAALGAGRRRIVLDLLTESALLAAAGGALGVGVAWAAVAAYRANGGLVASYWVDVRLDGPALLVVLGATGLAALLGGLLPALRASRLAPGRVLEGRSGGTGLRLGRAGHVLVIGQVALSTALVVATVLMVESVGRLGAHDFGDRPEGVWTGKVAPTTDASGRPLDDAGRLRFYDLLTRRIAAIPGVEDVALSSQLPSGRTPPPVGAELEGRGAGEPAAAAGEGSGVRVAVVAPGYFRALGRPLGRGRDFAASDTAETEAVALVNRSFVERVLGGSPAVGRRVRLAGRQGPGPWLRIVGVAPDLLLDYAYFEERIGAGTPPAVYVPLAQHVQPGVTLVVRTGGDASRLTPEIRAVVAKLLPDVAVLWPGTLAGSIDQTTSTYRTVRTLLSALAAVALLLAAVGLHGLLAFSVGARRRELGIRSALGARRGDLAALVSRSAALQVGAGLLLGLGLGAFVARLLAGLLYGMGPWDPAAFAASSAVLLAAGALASAGPVRRTLRVEPAEVLRAE